MAYIHPDDTPWRYPKHSPLYRPNPNARKPNAPPSEQTKKMIAARTRALEQIAEKMAGAPPWLEDPTKPTT